MQATVKDLSESEIEIIENALEEYDNNHIKYKVDGRISIGVWDGQTFVGGLDAQMTAFKILYVSTVFIKSEYRRKGYGRLLLHEAENRAKALGANTIRLDTFDWQGKEFYKSLGYTEVGHYTNSDDGYEEFFFLKRI